MILTRGHAFKPSGFYESISPKASAGRPKRKRLNHPEPVSKNSPRLDPCAQKKCSLKSNRS